MNRIHRGTRAKYIGISGVILLMVAISTQAVHGEELPAEHNMHSMTATEMDDENPSPEASVSLPDKYVYPANSNQSGQRALVGQEAEAFSRSESVIGPVFDRQAHLFELPRSNKILSCAGSGNNSARNVARSFTCQVYNWATGTKQTLNLPSDWFCGAGVFDADGNLIFAGGTANDGYPAVHGKWLGSNRSYKLNSQTLAITRLGNMNERRWYNNIIRNWYSENIYTYGGLNNGVFSSTWERLRPGTTQWQTMAWHHTDFNYADYKVIDRNHVAYTGVSTSERSAVHPAEILDLRDGSSVQTPGLRDVDRRNGAAPVMVYPAQNKHVVVFGGGTARAGVFATSSVDEIDYSVYPNATPQFVARSPMPTPAIFVLATNLPNGQVFVTGGTEQWRAGEVHWSALYTPSSDTWTVLQPSKIGRNYHSNIATRLDGRPVAYSGNPTDGSFTDESEIFTPWYKYRPQPVIGTHAPTMAYGKSYAVNVNMPQGTTVGKVTLDSPRSTTHSASDTNYGLFDLNAVATNNGVQVTVPANGSIPPGWYKMSVVTGGEVTLDGASGMVPSKTAVWVKITR